ADRNRSHWSTSKTPSYTKSVSWQHHRFSANGLFPLSFPARIYFNPEGLFIFRQGLTLNT
ncbi:hypothetical protein, partial [Escherichia coli]|uniref:hypothetical protein n=1 Tax=Escherichia coli TaxID=562 RepID=UPI001BD4BDF3